MRGLPGASVSDFGLAVNPVYYGMACVARGVEGFKTGLRHRSTPKILNSWFSPSPGGGPVVSPPLWMAP